MEIMKAFTDLEQSKRLVEILPFESSDCHYIVQHEQSYFYGYSLPKSIANTYNNDIKYIPCWSLTALLSIISIEHNLHGYLTENGMVYRVETLYAGNSKSYENPVDACMELIVKIYKGD